MRAHSTILEQCFGFHHKLSELVIGNVGVEWATGCRNWHFLALSSHDVRHLNFFFLVLIKFVNFLLGGVKQVSQDLVFMLKGILRVFAGSFFEKDTLVLGARFRLWAWNRDTLGLLAGGSHGFLHLGGLNGGPKL